MSDEEPKLIAIDEEADHQIVHGDRCGKANGTTYKPFNPGPQIDLRCGKVILVVGQCEDVDQANGATALAQQPVVARENAQSSGSRRLQNSPPHRQ
jgi:hypothetical protein